MILFSIFFEKNAWKSLRKQNILKNLLVNFILGKKFIVWVLKLFCVLSWFLDNFLVDYH